MPRVCLLKPEISKLQQKLDSGEITTSELSNMTSEARGKYLRELLGEDGGAFANGVFERKLLLQNQQKAMESWINKMTDASEPAKRDMLSRISRMEKLLSESDQERFLTELAETKLGAKVTAEEANTLLKLSKEATALENLKGTERRMEYGFAKRKFDNYVDDLKNPQNTMNFIDSIKYQAKHVKNPLDIVSGAGGLFKSLKSAFDLSGMLRQGYKVLLADPKAWGREAFSYFNDFWKTILKKGEDPMEYVMADIVSHADYDKAIKGRVALGLDEFIPTTIQEKMPVFGKVYKASDTAYKGFLFKSRMGRFSVYLKQAEKIGIDTNDTDFLKALGNYVNQQTGRGNLGKLEPVADFLNNVLFSPRFFASHLETITHAFTGGYGMRNAFRISNKGQNFIRRKAAIQLGKIAGTILLFKAISDSDIDPRATKFGKVKVGGSYNDITGGLGGVLSFISRMLSGKSISANGNKIDLTSKAYGARTRSDVFFDYTRGKLAPIPSTIINLFAGKDVVGKKVTPISTITGVAAPIQATNVAGLIQDDKLQENFGSMVLDFFGSSSSRYDR